MHSWNDNAPIYQQLADRLAALGMISVFDVEEVGAEVLVDDVKLGPAARCAAVRART